MNTPVLETRHLTIGYQFPRRPVHRVAEDISVRLNAGELVCLIGPNGAGKSTLLRTLAGMQAPLDGQALLMGDNVHRLDPQERAKRVSVVLTERLDTGMMTAYALVALGRYPHTDWSGRLTPHDETVVQWAIESVGGADLAGRNVSELSDGERQKMMIARALAQEPALMILDEPTAFLDLPRRAEIMQVLRQLAHNTGRAVLLSTHDLELAMRSADRLWLLASGGELHVGAPEDLVLNGQFEAAFRSEGIEFDPHTGSFRVHQNRRQSIHMTGSGIPAIWTQRALERAGFRVVQNGSPSAICVSIVPQATGWVWRINIEDAPPYDCASLHEVVAYLQNRQP